MCTAASQASQPVFILLRHTCVNPSIPRWSIWLRSIYCQNLTVFVKQLWCIRNKSADLLIHNVNSDYSIKVTHASRTLTTTTASSPASSDSLFLHDQLWSWVTQQRPPHSCLQIPHRFHLFPAHPIRAENTVQKVKTRHSWWLVNITTHCTLLWSSRLTCMLHL